MVTRPSFKIESAPQTDDRLTEPFLENRAVSMVLEPEGKLVQTRVTLRSII
jgi:hypothetical protein